MLDIIRDGTVGQIINYLSAGKILPYPDQIPGYQYPRPGLQQDGGLSATISRDTLSTRVPTRAPSTVGNKAETNFAKAEENAGNTPRQVPVENEFLIDWDGPTDPDNPRNWSLGKRTFITISISFLTFSVYIGSAIYTASIPSLMQDFGVTTVVGTLGLSLYVFAYGVGPMVLSPLQEIPAIGRNPVYIATLFLFVVIQVPTALATNMATVLGLRFFAGFVASPALATGGATLGDIFPPNKMPYVVGVWSLAAVAGPVIGPTIGGFAAQHEGWRWPIWELLWISGAALAFLSFLLPETLGDTILLKKARRIRKLTGDERYLSESEIKQANISPKALAAEALIRPFQLMLEPAVTFINFYIALAYAIFYLWFEAFPLVFVDIYHFNLGVSGLPFIGLMVGAVIAYLGYAAIFYFVLEPKMMREGPPAPEAYLHLALATSLFIPTSLFIFGWTSRESVHWIVPIIGAATYMPGIYILFQCALVYLPVSYPKYAASILAGNDFFRSTFASAFPLFGRPFFRRLGLGGGSSFLAGLAILMIPALYALIKHGAALRARSKYATV